MGREEVGAGVEEPGIGLHHEGGQEAGLSSVGWKGNFHTYDVLQDIWHVNISLSISAKSIKIPGGTGTWYEVVLQVSLKTRQKLRLSQDL